MQLVRLDRLARLVLTVQLARQDRQARMGPMEQPDQRAQQARKVTPGPQVQRDRRAIQAPPGLTAQMAQGFRSEALQVKCWLRLTAQI